MKALTQSRVLLARLLLVTTGVGGVILDQSVSYDALNRLTSAAGATRTLDAAGNLTQTNTSSGSFLAVLPASASLAFGAQSGLTAAVPGTVAWTATRDTPSGILSNTGVPPVGVRSVPLQPASFEPSFDGGTPSTPTAVTDCFTSRPERAPVPVPSLTITSAPNGTSSTATGCSPNSAVRPALSQISCSSAANAFLS